MNIYKMLVAEPQSIFIHTTLCTLTLIFAVPATLLTLPLWLVFVLFQWITATWILFWKTGQILAAQDIPFAHGSSTHNFITCSFTMKGDPNVHAVRRAFSTKILESTDTSHVRLKQCMQSKMGRYIRSDEENFDIEKHIFVYEGTPPKTDDELTQCYCELINRKIPSNISPWQFIIIPRGRKSGAHSFEICGRIHHTIGDGYALVGLFGKLVDNKPEILKPDTKKRKGNGILKVLRAIFTGPFVLVCMLLTSIENPFRRKKILGEIKVAWTKPFDLADIKKIGKNKFGKAMLAVSTGILGLSYY